MHKKLTITIDEKVYFGLRKVVGQGKISRFVEDLVRPHVLKSELESAYEEMAKDRNRENEALEWSEATLGDSAYEKR
ncbi:MAG: addiction module antitoxin [Armatimonadetes bacterium]|nr:addiction module antitoxin [Armatimonadota bacterium]